MISILAAALLIQTTTLPTPYTSTGIGRLSFMVGMCQSMGWRVDEEGFDFYTADLVGGSMSENEIIRNIGHGVELAQEDSSFEVSQITGRETAIAWSRMIEQRCDELARLYPTIIQRTPETATKWAEYMEGVERLPEVMPPFRPQ